MVRAASEVGKVSSGELRGSLGPRLVAQVLGLRGLFVGLGVVLALVPGVAFATTLEDVSLERLIDGSDRIVVARVSALDIVSSGPEGQSGIHTRVLLDVSETLLGPAEPQLEVWVHGGELDGRRRVVAGQASFVPGEEVVLFLFEAGGGIWPTAMAQGKWAIEQGSLHPPSAPGHHPHATLRSTGPDGPHADFGVNELRALIAARRGRQ